MSWLREFWVSWEDHPFVCLFILLTVMAGLIAGAISTAPPPRCETHVPDPERNFGRVCGWGAHVEVVDHVALCVCPPASRTVASDGDE